MIDDIRSIYCLLKGLKGETTSGLKMAVRGEPAPKKIPSLSTKKKFVVVDEKSIEEAKRAIVPKNTEMSTS